MPIRSKVTLLALLAALTLLTAGAYAATITPQIGGGISQFDGGVASQGAAAPAATGKVLMVDGASFILQTDGASKICRAGGC